MVEIKTVAIVGKMMYLIDDRELTRFTEFYSTKTPRRYTTTSGVIEDI